MFLYWWPECGAFYIHVILWYARQENLFYAVYKRIPRGVDLGYLTGKPFLCFAQKSTRLPCSRCPTGEPLLAVYKRVPRGVTSRKKVNFLPVRFLPWVNLRFISCRSIMK